MKNKRHKPGPRLHNTPVTVTPHCRVIRTVIYDQPIYFTITNRKDAIQSHHATGQFYEMEELEIIRRWCPPGAVFVDIGANIGNHALFALKFLHVARLIPFEPNPVAIEVLRSNLDLNGEADRCDLTHLGFGLSDQAQAGLQIELDQPETNLGGGRLVEGGDLTVIRGDDALATTHVDFIKIDVEGMEIKALRGLSQTIANSRPVFFIEVDEANRADFLAWVSEADYSIAATYRRYDVNENFLLVPAEKAHVSVA